MNKYAKLALVSFVILFLELLLIRVLETEIRIFAYFSNLILLGIFFGSGLGMLLKKKFPLHLTAVLFLALSGGLALNFFGNITQWLAPLSESFIWFQTDVFSLLHITAGLALTAVIFFLTLAAFVPLGQYLGELLESSPRTILAYSINVAASLGGMWAFALCSANNVSPYAALVMAQLLLFFLVSGSRGRTVLGVSLVLTVALFFGNPAGPAEKTIWSPYQKLTLSKLPDAKTQPQGYLLQVNGVGYMGLLDLSDKYKDDLARQLVGQTFPKDFDIRFADQYRLPYNLKPAAQDVLIIGAGGGNDVAAAVRASATERVDAVEIDPQIVKIGREYHPEQPYSSPKVSVIVDDGRAFFRNSQKQYDLIIMGLADSHTLTSSLVNVRLDNYLYTKESFVEARRLLKPDGLMVVSFDVRRPWIGERIQKSLTAVFGSAPQVYDWQNTAFFGWGGIVFVAEREAGAVERSTAQNPELGKFLEARRISFENGNKTKLLSDDWPYLYLDLPRLPKIHIFISLFLILFFVLLRKSVSWQGKFRWDFFFLGAGFLLYEFQNISKTSLLFGNTWMTNLFTITAILFFILLANLVYAKWRIPLAVSAAGLLGAISLQFVIPFSVFNSLAFYSRVAAASLVLNLPLFFSGLIFISLFAKAEKKSAAFASNLLGSAAGGLLEILSFRYGIRSLIFVSFGFYFCVLLWTPLVARLRMRLKF